ncbi:hypothetical protein E2C01_025329 [Portunus trituberculatus]|uniref:Uncharacterized protein n=1 Tax=Portunus trituberculatus TaxID=210409 RepID=A0A5B7EEV8_PORTR|nr:hypothetical protein [Portunus trituberculatus]
MPKVSRKVGSRKILTFFHNEGVFGRLENRVGMILGRLSPLLCVQHKEIGL